MQWMKNHRVILIETLFLVALFFVSQLPLRDFDIWFHIKSGELFVKQGYLSTTESFSYAASGREWTTFEWLFQIIFYYISTIGLWAIPPVISLFVVLGLGLLLRILGSIYAVPLVARIALVFAFWVSTYEFNTARPHTIAYTFLITHLFLILMRIHKGKRWIYWSPLLTLVWSNVHSTGFLAWGFLLSFGLVTLVQKQKAVARDLLLLALINAGITLLPPMGLADYRLLWRFFREREFLGYFISEWGPPSDNPFGLKLYVASIIAALSSWMSVAIVKRRVVESLAGLPFIVMAIVGFSATRNIYLGTLGLLLLLGSSTRHLLDWVRIPYRFWTITAFAVFLFGFYGWVYALKYNSVHANRLYYPLQATEFIRAQNIKGNMFNDYNYGAYMLYRLYPLHHVFIDGRADVYECCEMRDYLLLAYNKNMNDQEYRLFLKQVWEKYDISYAVMVTTKHNVMRKIATLLNTDPDWVLVFWDDDSQIFVRKDGKNDSLIERFGAYAATPYLRNPYVTGNQKQAQEEYERMDKLAPSARTSNAIGYMLLSENKFDVARTRFNEALILDPTFESPYMNLAELAVKDGDIDQAISLYYKAQRLAHDRGLIYIRLGQLVLEKTGDRKRVKKIWENGVALTVDDDARERLKELLSTL